MQYIKICQQFQHVFTILLKFFGPSVEMGLDDLHMMLPDGSLKKCTAMLSKLILISYRTSQQDFL